MIMDQLFFKATQGKDGMFYLRVVEPSKGVLGQLIEKSGFLKFLTEDEADAALDTLQGGHEGIEIVFGSKQTNSDLYNISVVVVEPEPATAQ